MTFKIYLPQAQGQRWSSNFPFHWEATAEEAKPLCGPNTKRQLSTREFLGFNGYIHLKAKSGTYALSIARQYEGPIYLMITDVVTPEIGRAKLAAEPSSERPDMKVLFVSGYAETTVQRHGAVDVSTRCLQKPFP